MKTLAWWSQWFRGLPIFDPPTTRLPKTPDEIARDIDAILYSDLTNEQMLQALSPYVQLGEHVRLFVKRTGLQVINDFVCGPYPTDYCVSGCGLEFVMDDLLRIHIIRRAQKNVGSRNYPQKSISNPIMRTHGYARWYES